MAAIRRSLASFSVFLISLLAKMPKIIYVLEESQTLSLGVRDTSFSYGHG